MKKLTDLFLTACLLFLLYSCVTNTNYTFNKLERQMYKSKGVNASFPTMVLIPSGTFHMVSCDPPCPREGHRVTIGSFYASKYEITNSQYAYYLNDKDSLWLPDSVDKYICLETDNRRIELIENQFVVKKGFENHPVNAISYHQAISYCNWLTEYMRAKSKKKEKWKYLASYRLATYYEWPAMVNGTGKEVDSLEYRYSGSNNIGEVAWYKENSLNRIHSVGSKKANKVGIYDLSGNLSEWIDEEYPTPSWAKYYSMVASIPPEATSDSMFVVGGSFLDDPMQLDSTGNKYKGYCKSCTPKDVGFRVTQIYLGKSSGEEF